MDATRIERFIAKEGEDAWVAGTRLPVSEILHFLSVVGSVEEVKTTRLLQVRRIELSTESVLACIDYGLQQIHRRELSRPLAAAFVQHWRYRRIDTSIQEGRVLAEEVLSAFSSGDVADASAILGRTADEVAIGFSYASAVVRNGRFPEWAPEDTSLRDTLEQQDRALVDEFFLYRSELASHPLTPEILIQRWDRLAQALEVGSSDWSLDELLNELEGRDILEDGVGLVSLRGRSVFRQRLDPLDERYEMTTRPARSDLWGLEPWRPLRWWWYRRPTKMSSSLENDMRSRGLI